MAAKTEKQKKRFGANLDFSSKEAYNLLRTNLIFSFAQGGETKVVGITSSSPQEGKSFTVLNLAYSLAEAGYKVCLIDADMRRPSLYKTVEKPISPGLSNILVGNETNVIHDAVLHPNLSMIMAGDIPPNPSELLGSERLKKMLDLLSAKFNYILFDLPPVLSVADPLVISKYLDGMMVVVKHNYTRRKDVNECMRQLKFTGVRILGFIYNSFSTGSSYRSYGKNYRRGYYRGYYRRSSGNTAPTAAENNVKPAETAETKEDKKD